MKLTELERWLLRDDEGLFALRRKILDGVLGVPHDPQHDLGKPQILCLGALLITLCSISWHLIRFARLTAQVCGSEDA